MVRRIETPAHAGARDQARDLADILALDLTGEHVVLDCSKLLVGTPSFLDEIVKQVLVRRNAKTLCVQAASSRVHDLLERSAENRALSDRLKFAVPS
jgi:hypothetical protein